MNKYIKFFIVSFSISLFTSILLYKIFHNKGCSYESYNYSYEYSVDNKPEYWKIRYFLLNFVLQYQVSDKEEYNTSKIYKEIKNNYKKILKDNDFIGAVDYLLNTRKKESSIKVKRYINNLLLEQYYKKGFYKKFLELYQERRFVYRSKISLLALHSFIKLKKEKEARVLFDKIFLNKINSGRIISCIGRVNYNKFYNKYDNTTIFNKLYDLIRRNKYSFLRREINYIKNYSSKLYFQAEIAYSRKNYFGAKMLLKKVNNIDLLPYKKQLLAKIGVRKGDFTLFYSTLEYLKKNKNSYVMEDFLLNVVKISYLKKENMEFVKEVLDIIVKEGDSSILGDAYWYLFRVSLGDREYDKALKFLKDYNKKSKNYNESVDFWLSKLSKEKRKNQIGKRPFSYYYTLQNSSVNNRSKRIYLNKFKKLLNEPSSKLGRIIKSIRSFLPTHTLNESLEYISLLERKVSSESDKIVLCIVKSMLWSKKGNLLKAYVSYRKSFKGYRSVILPYFIKDILMPVRYWEIIKKESAANNLNPYLVVALIRQESFYNANARSPVGARGLMQIMPATARYIARSHNIYYNKAKLYNAAYNIKLGCIYLKEMLTRYKGSICKTLASYNAGPHRVDKWEPKIGDLGDDYYPEVIPFKETRNYIKNIKRNIFYYRYYYPQYGK